MRHVLLSFAFAASLLGVHAAAAPQYSKHDPLSDSEIEELRETADAPAARLKLFLRFLDERSAKITELDKDKLVEHRGVKLHDAIDHFTSLVDELQNNLDEYQEYETNKRRPVPDLRKDLEELQKSLPVWQTELTGLAADEDYNFVLETAREAVDSLQDQAAEMVTDQQKYFAEKKRLERLKEKQQDKGDVSLP